MHHRWGCWGATILLLLSCSPQPIRTASGLVYQVTKKGKGPAATSGQRVSIHETTRLSNGRVLKSTHTQGKPLTFLLGGKQVIDGIDEAVTGMRVGERRTLVVPPRLSRRTSYSEGLKPEDTLNYQVELVHILPR